MKKLLLSLLALTLTTIGASAAANIAYYYGTYQYGFIEDTASAGLTTAPRLGILELATGKMTFIDFQVTGGRTHYKVSTATDNFLYKTLTSTNPAVRYTVLSLSQNFISSDNNSSLINRSFTLSGTATQQNLSGSGTTLIAPALTGNFAYFESGASSTPTVTAFFFAATYNLALLPVQSKYVNDSNNATVAGAIDAARQVFSALGFIEDTGTP